MNRRIPAGTYGGVRGWRYELFRILLYSIVQHAEKANAQIGTFGFCRPTSQTQKTKRAYLFAYARTE